MTREEYDKQWLEFVSQSSVDGRFSPRIEDQHIILNDDKPAHDELDFSFDYWAHCSWAARKIAALKPERHVDFGSYAYFAGICSAFVNDFCFCDIRTLPTLPGLRCDDASLTNLEWYKNEKSISCLHVLEHVGLGRYGDTLDAQGDLKAARELSRILAPGGQLLMVLPMNEKPRVQFNGERMYSFHQVVNEPMFPGLTPTEFSVIHAGRFIKDADLKSVGMDNYTGCFAWSK